MDKWIDVVTHPLGLAGFALFMVFVILPKMVKQSGPSWISPAAYAMALVALLGGLGLAFVNSQKSEPSPPVIEDPTIPTVIVEPTIQTPDPQKPRNEKPDTVIQLKSSGDFSPPVLGGEGDVTININKGDDNRSGDENR